MTLFNLIFIIIVLTEIISSSPSIVNKKKNILWYLMTSLWYFDNPLKNVFETSTILINARAMELFL